MNRLAPREGHSLLPDFGALLESPFLPLRYPPGIRVEDFVREGRYVVRAELPGVAPDEDISVTVLSGALTISAEHRKESREDRCSEFRYGSFTRTVSPPKGADEDDVSASYGNGILEVGVGLTEREEGRRQVNVSRRDR
ncbi:Hsp20/alpha crystallin family protein [Allosalinactinospora lopnorensis]|uniref:Hsp20/alpha crystallin family protein n=1 Tax=Allosalinactinospora lopnorensis TaxID=1352348 RepID=UPI000623D65A|nr:Hsp20/alpha crystallin family protein [Allosalinactinospora lopnorensis]